MRSRGESEELESTALPMFLQDPIGVVKRRWLAMTLVASFGLAATAGFLMVHKPTYVGTATVLVASQSISKDFVRPTVNEDPFERLNALVGEILSRDSLADLIQKHDLYPEIRKSQPMLEAVARMRRDIHVEPDEGIGPQSSDDTARLFTISFDSTSPETAASVANDLASLFTAESIRSGSQQAQLTTSFLQSQLAKAKQALHEQDATIRDFKEKYRGQLPSELNANLQKLERLQQQRQSLAVQIADAETRLAALSVPDKDSNSPEAQLEAARAHLAHELAINTEEHPDVAAARRQVAALEAVVAQEGKGSSASMPPSRAQLVAAARRAQQELRTQLQETEKDIQDLDAKVSQTPARQEALSALEQKDKVLRDTYTNYLQKVQEAQLAQSLQSAQQGERFSVVDRAEPPTQPKHAPWKYGAMGGVASFGLAFLIGIALELRDPVVFSAEQLATLVDAPLLGTVSRIA